MEQIFDLRLRQLHLLHVLCVWDWDQTSFCEGTFWHVEGVQLQGAQQGHTETLRKLKSSIMCT